MLLVDRVTKDLWNQMICDHLYLGKAREETFRMVWYVPYNIGCVFWSISYNILNMLCHDSLEVIVVVFFRQYDGAFSRPTYSDRPKSST